MPKHYNKFRLTTLAASLLLARARCQPRKMTLAPSPNAWSMSTFKTQR